MKRLLRCNPRSVALTANASPSPRPDLAYRESRPYFGGSVISAVSRTDVRSRVWSASCRRSEPATSSTPEQAARLVRALVRLLSDGPSTRATMPLGAPSGTLDEAVSAVAAAQSVSVVVRRGY